MPVPVPPYDLATWQLIYEILVGEKRYFGGRWHVYDSLGVEIPDPGEILMRGNIGALLAKGVCCIPGVNEWLTEQGVARNLARNLARRQRQDCRVRVWSDPVPTGAATEATVRATSRVKGVAEGLLSGCGHIARGTAHATATAEGRGVVGGATVSAGVVAASETAALGHGLRCGGGRVRAHASARVAPAGASAYTGPPEAASARGVRNPSDEEMMAIALFLVRKRGLTSAQRRL